MSIVIVDMSIVTMGAMPAGELCRWLLLQQLRRTSTRIESQREPDSAQEKQTQAQRYRYT